MLIFLLFIGFFVVRYVLALRQYKRSSYYVVTRNSFFYVRSDKGRFGEYCTYLKLRDLEEQGGKFLFNVYIPTPNGTTEIDLLMICRRGIFVFESKNYSGWIFGKESQQKWTQTLPHGRGSYKEHFYNPVLQNKGHLQALQNYIGAEVPLWSIIVFSERCTLKNVQVTSPNISVVNRYDLLPEVTMRLNRAPAVFSEEDVERVYAFLYPCSQVSAAVKAQHIENITSH